MIGADDALDVFGVHALGGIFGALMTGIFNDPTLGGPGLVTDWVMGTVGYPGRMAQFIDPGESRRPRVRMDGRRSVHLVLHREAHCRTARVGRG